MKRLPDQILAIQQSSFCFVALICREAKKRFGDNVLERVSGRFPDVPSFLLLFLRRGQTEGHEFALETAVVEAAFLVCAATKATLKARVTGDGGERKAWMTAKEHAHFAIQFLAFLAVAQAFAVGGIAKERTAFAFDLSLTRIPHREGHMSGKTCLLEMTVGQFYRFWIDIRTGDALDARWIECCLGFLTDGSKSINRHIAPAFQCKFAGEPRSPVGHLHGSFNHQRTRAAHRIVQAHAGTPGGEGDKRCCERFAQRRFTVPGAVTASVKRYAAGVQR
jgi:hypothetical protein